MTQTVVADKTGAAADLPILDYSKLTGASDEKRLALRQLDEAFQTYGFMYLENHSVPQELIEEAFEWVSIVAILVTWTSLTYEVQTLF